MCLLGLPEDSRPEKEGMFRAKNSILNDKTLKNRISFFMPNKKHA